MMKSISCLLGIVITGGLLSASNQTKPEPPTYAGNVAEILNKHCVNCHRPGEVAPFSLIGYDNAKRWSRMITVVTDNGQMPPWKAEPGHGKFLFENRLTPAEKATLINWYKVGAPRGNKNAEPVAPKFSGAWTLGKPDLIVKPPKAYKLAAEGDDVYRNFPIDTNFDQPVWIAGIDIHAGNKKVVHHVIVFQDEKGISHALAAQNKDGQPGYSSFGGVGFVPNGALGGWVPGLRPLKAPQGMGFLVKPHTTLVLQVHYHKSGKEELDQTELGLYFAQGPVTKELDLLWLFNFGIDIPAGQQDHAETVVRTMPADATLYSVMPHMHLLGRQMKADAELPSGKKIPLIYIKDWDFNWQMNYVFQEPIKLPKGTKIIIEAHYDNSPTNPKNPSRPPKRVTWGEQTTDEMFLLLGAVTWDGGTPPWKR